MRNALVSILLLALCAAALADGVVYKGQPRDEAWVSAMYARYGKDILHIDGRYENVALDVMNAAPAYRGDLNMPYSRVSVTQPYSTVTDLRLSDPSALPDDGMTIAVTGPFYPSPGLAPKSMCWSWIGAPPRPIAVVVAETAENPSGWQRGYIVRFPQQPGLALNDAFPAGMRLFRIGATKQHVRFQPERQYVSNVYIPFPVITETEFREALAAGVELKWHEPLDITEAQIDSTTPCFLTVTPTSYKLQTVVEHVEP